MWSVEPGRQIHAHAERPSLNLKRDLPPRNFGALTTRKVYEKVVDHDQRGAKQRGKMIDRRPKLRRRRG